METLENFRPQHPNDLVSVDALAWVPELWHV
jgi:hypothetical protein